MCITARTSTLGTALVCLAVTFLPGCKFFDISNPLLPASRLYAVPVPALMEITNTYAATERTMRTNVADVNINISTFPNDGTPGCYINNYAAEYFDNSGNPIDSLEISKTNLPISVYIPPASNGTVSSVTVMLPVYHQEVARYGIRQNFADESPIRLRDNLTHSISCRVVLSGQDDNFNQIEVPVSIPIRFIGEITQ